MLVGPIYTSKKRLILVLPTAAVALPARTWRGANIWLLAN